MSTDMLIFLLMLPKWSPTNIKFSLINAIVISLSIDHPTAIFVDESIKMYQQINIVYLSNVYLHAHVFVHVDDVAYNISYKYQTSSRFNSLTIMIRIGPPPPIFIDLSINISILYMYQMATEMLMFLFMLPKRYPINTNQHQGFTCLC
jgi:hypothetical protein